MYIDSHTHLQFPQYDKDRDDVIRRALENGVRLINVGTDKEMSEKAVKLTEKVDEFFAAVGLHPTDIEEDFDYNFYKKLAGRPKVVAVGECGLDYCRLPNGEAGISNLKFQISKQKEVFQKHIELAKEVGKPLMVHCRPRAGTEDAYNDLYEMLKGRVGNLKGAVIHFFVGNPDTAKKFLGLGCYFTFGGVITFTRDYDEVVKTIPLDRILLETDAPFVAPEPHRGKRNEPAYVVEVYKKMAELKNIPLEDLKKQVWENNQKAFGITLSSRG